MKEVFIITRERHGAKEYLCSVRGEEFWFNDHKIAKTYPSYASAAAVLQAREVPHTEIDIRTLYGIDKKFVVTEEKTVTEGDYRRNLDAIDEQKPFSVLAEIEMAMAAGRERHITFRAAHLTSEWYKKVIQEINNMTSIFDQAKISTSNSGNRELWFNTKFGAVLIEPQIDGRDGNMLSRYSRRGYMFPQHSPITHFEHVWYNLDKKELHHQ